MTHCSYEIFGKYFEMRLTESLGHEPICPRCIVQLDEHGAGLKYDTNAYVAKSDFIYCVCIISLMVLRVVCLDNMGSFLICEVVCCVWLVHEIFYNPLSRRFSLMIIYHFFCLNGIF